MLFGESPLNGAIVGAVHPPFAQVSPSRCRKATLSNSKNAVVGVAGDGEAVRLTVPMCGDDAARPVISVGLDCRLDAKSVHG